jgi:hypothetical protein
MGILELVPVELQPIWRLYSAQHDIVFVSAIRYLDEITTVLSYGKNFDKYTIINKNNKLPYTKVITDTCNKLNETRPNIYIDIINNKKHSMKSLNF